MSRVHLLLVMYDVVVQNSKNILLHDLTVLEM
jgi:hypothetical protein